jgi:hypothetical protein
MSHQGGQLAQRLLLALLLLALQVLLSCWM